MPAGTRRHDHEMWHHTAPRRIKARVWLRPARCAHFTSLRDVSLRRNRTPGLCPALMLCMIVMRGLRAGMRASIDTLFWLRPARCAHFTSLRDVGLHRNRTPGLCPALMLCMIVMRGPRA